MKLPNFKLTTFIQSLIVTIFLTSLGIVFLKPGVLQNDPLESKFNELENRLVQLEKIIFVLEE